MPRDAKEKNVHDLLMNIWVFLNETKVEGKKLIDLKKDALRSCKLLHGLFTECPLHHCPGANPRELPYD